VRNLAGSGLLFLLAACASQEVEVVEPKVSAPAGKGMTVTVLGDGFVRADGQRIPLEAWILRARQHLRSLPREERPQFWIQVERDVAAGAAVQPYVARLVQEFSLMGVQLVFWM
jgi:hypothetical protein